MEILEYLQNGNEMALTSHLTLIRVYEQFNTHYYYHGTVYLKINITNTI
jgi:hypothetical protein